MTASEPNDVVALLVAAGHGTRMGRDTPKQFQRLGGRMLLHHAVGALARSSCVGRIVVVVTPGWEDRVRAELAEREPRLPLGPVVAGGATRQDSVWHGLQSLPNASYVLVHDAARPFPEAAVISATVAAARRSGAATAALPLADTLMRAQETPSRTGRTFASECVERGGMWAVQTPQVFELELLRAAHANARERGIRATDDCGLVLELGRAVELVRGSAWNIKVTSPEDWQRARWILRAGPADSPDPEDATT